MPISCVKCNGPLTTGHKFCPFCGAPAPEDEAAAKQSTSINQTINVNVTTSSPQSASAPTAQPAPPRPTQTFQPRRRSAGSGCLFKLFLLAGLGIAVVVGVPMLQKEFETQRQITAERHDERISDQIRAALSAATQEIRRNPTNPHPYSERAWILATCPIDDIRDGEQAVKDGIRLCEIDAWENPGGKATLAAAYAEIGNFEEALRSIRQALEEDPYGSAKPQRLQMQTAFQNNQPFRDHSILKLR